MSNEFLGTGWNFPIAVDASRQVLMTPDGDIGISQSIWIILSTAPGERLMRPDFGCGIHDLVFAPNSPELAATVQFTIQAGLQRWLSDLIALQRVEVTAQESTLSVLVSYVIKSTGEQQSQTFVHRGDA